VEDDAEDDVLHKEVRDRLDDDLEDSKASRDKWDGRLLSIDGIRLIVSIPLYEVTVHVSGSITYTLLSVGESVVASADSSHPVLFPFGTAP